MEKERKEKGQNSGKRRRAGDGALGTGRIILLRR